MYPPKTEALVQQSCRLRYVEKKGFKMDVFRVMPAPRPVKGFAAAWPVDLLPRGVREGICRSQSGNFSPKGWLEAFTALGKKPQILFTSSVNTDQCLKHKGCGI